MLVDVVISDLLLFAACGAFAGVVIVLIIYSVANYKHGRKQK